MGQVTHAPVTGPNDATKQVSKTVYEQPHVVSLTLSDVGFPAGVIVGYGGAAAPLGWLLCDGTSYLRADYPALFTAISTAYGAADGTHFSVPDYRDRVIKGKGAATNLGDVAGSATHVHTDNLTHAGAAVAAHTFTQPAAHSAHSVTQPNAHSFTQPSAHSAHSFTQPGAHTNHAVTQPNAHAALAGHAHELPFQIVSATVLRMLAQTIFGSGTSRTPASTVTTSANTTAAAVALSQSVSAGTPDAHAGTAVDAHSAHSGGAVDAHSAHAGGAVDAHAGTAVDAHSAHSGGAVDAHAVTQPSAHGSHAAVNSEPPSQMANYIIKT